MSTVHYSRSSDTIYMQLYQTLMADVEEGDMNATERLLLLFEQSGIMEDDLRLQDLIHTI
jgi:hypothetical protein